MKTFPEQKRSSVMITFLSYMMSFYIISTESTNLQSSNELSVDLLTEIYAYLFQTTWDIPPILRSCNDEAFHPFKSLSTYFNENLPKYLLVCKEQQQKILHHIGSLLNQNKFHESKELKNIGLKFENDSAITKKVFWHFIALLCSNINLADKQIQNLHRLGLLMFNAEKNRIFVKEFFFDKYSGKNFQINIDDKRKAVRLRYEFSDYKQFKVIKGILLQDIYEYSVILDFKDYYYNENDFKELNLIDKSRFGINMRYTGDKMENQIVNFKPFRVYDILYFVSDSTNVASELEFENIIIGSDEGIFENLTIMFRNTYNGKEGKLYHSGNSRIRSLPKIYNNVKLRVIDHVTISSKGFPVEYKQELKEYLETLTDKINVLIVDLNDWHGIRTDLYTNGHRWDDFWF